MMFGSMNRWGLMLVLSFLVCFVRSQPEHNIWYFGSNAGLDFNTSPPTILTNGIINTSESCASISDASGNILFYTDGLEVRDANHNIMPNGSGLLGNISATCIILPKPGSANVYYIFVTDATSIASSNGLTYSEVDMSLNGGLGDVTANKNITICAESGEWLTAVPHANCTDIWVLTHGHVGSSSFLAYQVSSAGVNLTPVSTNIGFTIPVGVQNIGLMKPNRTGDTIIMTLPHHAKSVELIEFDQATGVATGITNLYTSTTNELAFGIEFSRSGKVLYVSNFGGEIHQFDMTAANIAATRTFVGEYTLSGEIGYLQIAPNDKIYVGYNLFAAATNVIGAINNPETLGLGCNYVQNAQSLGTATMVYGFPWYYNKNVTFNGDVDLGADSIICPGTTMELDAWTGSAGASYLWSDGSMDSVLNVNVAGEYWVEVQSGLCPPAYDTVVVEIDTTVIDQIVTDTIGCSPLTVQFSGTQTGFGVSNWTWNLGNGILASGQNPIHTYNTPGTYAVTLAGTSVNNCPLSTASVSTVEVLTGPMADFIYTPPANLTPGDEIFFSDLSTGTIVNWNWTTGDNGVYMDSTFSHVYDNDGTYDVTLTVTDDLGCTDEITYTILVTGTSAVYIPNAFSPNGDGKNDLFFAVAPEDARVELSIFNRWGELIWKGSANEAWTGHYQGNPAKADIYVWQARIQMSNTDVQVKRGHLTLLR